MIRIRDNLGVVLPLPSSAAIVELCSSDGKLARLILCGPARVTILDAKDPDFRSYCQTMKLEPAEIINLHE
jgi:hypothetical protein